MTKTINADANWGANWSEDAVPTSRAKTPIDAGCPHCGAGSSHPHSSRSGLIKSSAAKNANANIAAPILPPPPPERPNGKHAYDKWVSIVGHTDFAVPWDKLTGNAMKAWSSVAEDLERRTIEFTSFKNLATKTK